MLANITTDSALEQAITESINSGCYVFVTVNGRTYTVCCGVVDGIHWSD